MTSFSLRPLAISDLRAVERLCVSSAWTSLHFTPDELPRLLATRPAFGAFGVGDDLRAFMLASSVVPPSAWLGGFGVSFRDQARALALFDQLWPAWRDAMARLGASTAYLSGSDIEGEWLRDPLMERGWRLHELLRSYDKIGTTSPTDGNQAIVVRPFDTARDLAGVLAIERLAFDPQWRHDANEFAEIAAAYPYFVVAEGSEPVAPGGSPVVGYQFNVVESGLGYLVRIAVHPAASGQGIGARLMAEAMRYFAAHRVERVLLNTQEANARAHRLYEWFGFEQVGNAGFVLSREL